MPKQRVNSFTCKIRSSQFLVVPMYERDTFVVGLFSLQVQLKKERERQTTILFKSPPDLTTAATTSVVTRRQPFTSCTLVTGTLFLFQLVSLLDLLFLLPHSFHTSFRRYNCQCDDCCSIQLQVAPSTTSNKRVT